MKRYLIIAVVALASCHHDQPPAPTIEQTGRLDEAEDMLNQVDNEKGATPAGTAPSTNRN